MFSSNKEGSRNIVIRAQNLPGKNKINAREKTVKKPKVDIVQKNIVLKLKKFPILPKYSSIKIIEL